MPVFSIARNILFDFLCLVIALINHFHKTYHPITNLKLYDELIFVDLVEGDNFLLFFMF